MSYILMERVEGVRNSAAVQDIELMRTLPAAITDITNVAAVDYTGTVTSFTFGLKQGASEHLLETSVPPITGFVCSLSHGFSVDREFTIFVRVTGGSEGDRIALFANGWYH